MRYYGIDMLRLWSFIPILAFHGQSFIWDANNVPLSGAVPALALFEYLCRLLSFSGFTIVGLTGFLMGLNVRRSVQRLKLFALLLVAWIIFCLLSMAFRQQFEVDWDVYPLVILGVLSAGLFTEKFSRLGSGIIACLGFCLLWIPFWKLAGHFDFGSNINNVLGIAVCSEEIAEWPVFPWIGLVWFGFGCGGLVRKGLVSGSDKFVFKRRELLFWLCLLVVSFPHLGKMAAVPFGEEWGCAIYRFEPEVFWSHLVWPMFFVRLALCPRWNSIFKKSFFCRYVSDLAISRYFGLAYFIGFLEAYLVGIFCRHVAFGTDYYNMAVPICAYTMLPLCELLTRLVINLIPRMGLLRRQSIEA